MYQKIQNEAKVTIDIIFIALVLTVYFFWFYYKWHIGIDQGIHLYTAWGMLNGMKLYVDLVNIHLPGLMLMYIIAWFLGGAFPIGLRIVDIGCLFILCLSTSIILSRWKVNLPLRIIGVTLFLVSYFATGPSETAQKESFALPFTILGLLPLLNLSNKNSISKIHMIIFGMITAFGIWIKITPVLLVLFVLATNYFFSHVPKKEWLNQLMNYLIGIIIVSGLFIFWLIISDSFEGFLKWPIGYGLGPYLETRWSVEHIFHDIQKKIGVGGKNLPLLYALIGILLFLFFKRNNKLKIGHKRELLCTLGLILVSILSIFIQGKSLQYHFIPLQWSLVTFGSLLISLTTLSPDLEKVKWLSIIFCVIILGYSGIEFSKKYIIDTDIKIALRDRINQHLKADDQIVLFGNASFMYSYLQRKTPFPFIASLCLYNMVPPSSKIRKEIIESLVRSLQDPKVKLFLLQNRKTIPIHGVVENSKDIFLKEIGEDKLEELGYTKIFHQLRFDVYKKSVDSAQ